MSWWHVNSYGQFIGSYKTIEGKDRVFIGENDKVSDFNIDEELSAYGYQIINIKAQQINDNGNILGSFEYGHKHPLKNTWISEGTINFFWNGQIHFIPQNFSIIEMTANNEILVWTNESSDDGEHSFRPIIYAWHFNSELRFIMNGYYPLGSINSHNCYLHPTFNDKGQMLVTNKGRLLFFDNENYIDIQELLKDSEIKNPTQCSLNNNGMIVGHGSIWGESHVFVLRPEKK